MKHCNPMETFRWINKTTSEKGHGTEKKLWNWSYSFSQMVQPGFNKLYYRLTELAENHEVNMQSWRWSS